MIAASRAYGGIVANQHPRPRDRATVVLLTVLVIGALVVAGAIGWAGASGLFETATLEPSPSPSSQAEGDAGVATPPPTPSPTAKPPIGGTELYGYLPYWQMNDKIEAYLSHVPVSTLALFSVSPAKSGGLRTGELGYKRITGDRGRRLIAAAHRRGQRVELVFTSFGSALNTRLFADDPAAAERRARAARELLALAGDLGVDGLNVDVEQTEGDVSVGYASFLAALEAGLPGLGPKASLSVATTSSHDGAVLARAAVAAGADRVFLMGYEYHWSGSGPGASAPIRNRDLGLDLSQSIVDYVDSGVPRSRILLGLPLYGMSWLVAGPLRPTVALGRGAVWIPANHADVLLGPGFTHGYDGLEIADFIVVPEADAWRMTYFDSPGTLRPKLELARQQGLAGAGFWALGYENGLPGYVELMRDFVAGRIGG
jgi:spore germination protein